MNGEERLSAGKLLGGRLDTIRTHCLLRHPGLRLADSLCYWSSACFYALYLRRAIEDSPRYIEQKAKVTRKLTFGASGFGLVGGTSAYEHYALGAVVYGRIFILRHVPVASDRHGR